MEEKPVQANLFRFVTLRNPQLIEDKETGFVMHPDESQSEFLVAVKGLIDKDKPAALQAVSNNFPAYTTRSNLKNEFSALYKFSSWLMRNKNTLTFESIAANLNEEMQLNTSQEINIWENLIYQTVNKTSVYVREACIQLLIANKFLNVFLKFDNDKEENYKFNEVELKMFTRRAHASVVISKTLFSFEKSPKGVKYRRTSNADLHDIALTGAEYNMFYYEKAYTELKKIEPQFKREYQIAYDTALTAHEATIKSIIDAAEPTIIEIKDEFGNIRKEETYSDLDLPVFNFKKETIIDESYLLDKVSEDTINILKANQLDTFTDLSRIFSEIEKLKKDEANTIFKSKLALKPKSIKLHGASFKSGSTSPALPYCFTAALMGLTNGNSVIGMKLTTDYPNPTITDATFQIKYDESGTVKNGLSVINVSSINNERKANFVFGPLLFVIGSQITFSGEFSLDNGNTYTFSSTSNVVAHPFDKRRMLLAFQGCTQLKDGNGNTNPEPNIEINAPVYGVTNLGIADFRRVEQEVCCYVPGEVSHIENIMAREFKERSTRSLVSDEITDERSEERERENLTDTTTTERNEMQSEVAAVLNEDQSENYGANATVTTKIPGGGSFSAGAHADFSSSSSSSNSNSQAQTYAQEVTERAMERIVQKTQTKRTSRILKEFEENNSHGFDNRKGDQHISGVYRWVDKIYKNKLVNYGKRLMYEFSIPEPSKFFKEAIIKNIENGLPESAIILPTAPEHPSFYGIDSAEDLDETNYLNVASQYGAEVNFKPIDIIYVSASFGTDFSGSVNDGGSVQVASGKGEIEIPDGYTVGYANFAYSVFNYGFKGRPKASITIGGKTTILGISFNPGYIFNLNIKKKLGYSFCAGESPIMSGSIRAVCSRTDEIVEQWQNETYNAIMEAYEEKLRLYNEAMQANEVIPENDTVKLRFNPLENRALEKRELKRIAIELLAEQKGHTTSKNNYLGKNANGIAKVNKTEALQAHLATVKFFEQAFDWEIMSYIFYPYFYADEANWKDLFQQQEAADPIFQSFLQSGMARTVVPVRKGFEDAVNWYMITGELWNGEGLVVDQDNDLYVSVAEEMATIEGEVEGTWETRLPTSLTVIQAGAIGLNVEGLPCNSECKTGSLFDSDNNPIVKSDAQLGGENTDLENRINELNDTLDALKDKVEQEHP